MKGNKILPLVKGKIYDFYTESIKFSNKPVLELVGISTNVYIVLCVCV